MSLHSKIHLPDFIKLCQQSTDPADYPLADSVQKKIPCYHGNTFRQAEHDAKLRIALMQELRHSLQQGPGLFVISGAYTDVAILEQQNDIYQKILQQEAQRQTGDHFAKAGANSRIWNVLQKSALLDPQGFISYYKNPVLALASEAWLGPHFQMTAQVNIVHPGGRAQSPHRDYHLGFQSPDVLEHYPPHVHRMSSMLTLQGAVAHTDMPQAAGPTLLLPYSQQYLQGYLAWRDTEFIDYFRQQAVQLPLLQGDALFFNPALFHAAGDNDTADFHRIGNLLQVSSAFGRAMERVDRYAISQAIYPHLKTKWQDLNAAEQEALLSSACESYSFPTNLDSDPPLNGMAPETHKSLMSRALLENWTAEQFNSALTKHQQRRQA